MLKESKEHLRAGSVSRPRFIVYALYALPLLLLLAVIVSLFIKILGLESRESQRSLAARQHLRETIEEMRVLTVSSNWSYREFEQKHEAIRNAYKVHKGYLSNISQQEDHLSGLLNATDAYWLVRLRMAATKSDWRSFRKETDGYFETSQHLLDAIAKATGLSLESIQRRETSYKSDDRLRDLARDAITVECEDVLRQLR